MKRIVRFITNLRLGLPIRQAWMLSKYRMRRVK